MDNPNLPPPKSPELSGLFLFHTQGMKLSSASQYVRLRSNPADRALCSHIRTVVLP
ncbi:hypothetical protein EMIT051CA3_80294 [Pseudomonas chlororaphis]